MTAPAPDGGAADRGAALPVIAWELDAQGVVTRSMGSALSRLGLRDGERVGRSALEDDAASAPFWRRARAGEVVQWEARGSAATGPWVLETVAVPARDGGAVGVSVDVTERCLAEERYRELAEALPDILVVTDLEGHLVALNQAFETITGRRREDWLGQPFLPLVHPSDAVAVQRVLVHVARGEEPALFDVRVRRADDTYAQLECRIRPQRAGRRVVGAQGIARDVTERRRLEADVRHSQRLDSIGKLAGGIAHDFNNLLLVISGHAALLAEELAPGNEGRDHVDAIARSADRAADLTRRLLAFGRKQVLQAAEIRVDDAVRDTAEMLARLVGADVAVEVESGAGDAHVVVDPAQLEQVFVNLGVNARDALGPGGTLRFETRLTRLGRRRAAALEVPEGEYVRIAVEDTGCGMDAETLERIFDPFFTTKEPGKGTGLGLATVYGIVRQSGGCITASSRPGEGSRFEIHLPLARTAPPEPERPAAVRPPAAMTGERLVLVVGEDDDVRGFVGSILG